MPAPHTLLLWMQIVMEGIAMMNPNFHNLIRIMVPIGFSVYREKCLWLWFDDSVQQILLLPSLAPHNNSNIMYMAACWWNVGLSFCNLLLWSYTFIRYFIITYD